jgi:hypothetical protein
MFLFKNLRSAIEQARLRRAKRAEAARVKYQVGFLFFKIFY